MSGKDNGQPEDEEYRHLIQGEKYGYEYKESVLTNKERRYLYGLIYPSSELAVEPNTEQAERQMQSRMRKRIISAIRDFRLLVETGGIQKLDLPNETRQIIAGTEHRGLQSELSCLISAAYEMSQQSRYSFTDVVEWGFDAANTNPFHTGVNVEIEKREPVALGYIQELLSRGELPDPWEVGALIESGHANDKMPDSDDTYLDRILELAEQSDREADFITTL